MPLNWFGLIVLLVLLSVPLQWKLVHASELISQTSCVCPGYSATYNCIVDGGGVTIWRGSAVLHQCQSNVMLLRHSEFNKSSGYTLGCDGIVARSIRRINNTYISQLTVNVSQELNGLEVECAHDNGVSIYHIGSRTIILTTAPPSPPNDTTLIGANNEQLTFMWTPVTTDCIIIHYNILSSNCGRCPESTNNNRVTCAPESITGQTCIVTVQPVVCGNIASTSSLPVSVILKSPSVQNILITPEYHGDTKILTKIMLQFHEPVPFFITDTIDGSSNYYTVNYTNSMTGESCGGGVIPFSLCHNRICNHVLNVSSSPCSPFADIAVTVFATNIFGDSQATDPILISSTNEFAHIEFDFTQTNSVKCIFLNERDTSVKSCEITYWQGETCPNSSGSQHSHFGNPTVADTVVINLPQLYFPQDHSVYCYTLTAKNQTYKISVSGKFTSACNPGELGDGSIPNVTCGDSYITVGIENGLVCYTGTELGSTAIYYCFDCGFSTLTKTGSSIRKCDASGEWNGSVPQCDCSTSHPVTASNVVLYSTGISICFILLLVIVITIFSFTVIVLNRAKAKLKAELATERAGKIYEEINLDLVTQVNSNIAYGPVAISSPFNASSVNDDSFLETM